MVPNLEKSQIEIYVRIDCKGCIKKIKRQLHNINGIYDLYIDFPQQKLTIIGWADPEKIIKAIKKTRKIATICSHTQVTEPPTQGGGAARDSPNSPPPQSTPPRNSQPTKPPEVAATPSDTGQPPLQSSWLKNVGEVHGNHQPEPNYGYCHDIQPSPYVTHSYNRYMPWPYVTEYLLSPPRQCEYIQSPPRYTYNSTMDRYDENYHCEYNNGNGNGNGNNENIVSMFSDENPNACRIM